MYWFVFMGLNKEEKASTEELRKKYEDTTLVHTHKPLDDARYQGVLFVNALRDNISQQK